MKQIPLSKGQYALIDDNDYPLLVNYSWHYNTKGYAYYSKSMTEKVSMTSMIMNPPKGYEVDHIDRNPLNNQRYNLRIVTHQQNCHNRSKPKRGNSPYVGVEFQDGNWSAFLTINGKYTYLGQFPTASIAALARDMWEVYYHGKYAYTNFKLVSYN